TLVAVIVNDPAAAEENATDVMVGFAKDPPVLVQVTPAFPKSFATVALNSCVCEVVNPRSFGLMETVIVEGCVIAQLRFTLVTLVTVQVWLGWVGCVSTVTA